MCCSKCLISLERIVIFPYKVILKKYKTQFLVFPISTRVDITVYQYGKNVLYFFYNIAQRTLTKEWREIFRVDIELYQHGSWPISVQNLQMLYYADF